MTLAVDFSRPAFQSFYSVAGRLLFVKCNDQRLAQLVEPLFAGWLLTPSVVSNSRSDVNIDFYCNALLPEIPAGLEQFEIANEGRCYTDGHSCFLDLTNSRMVIDQRDAAYVGIWMKKMPEMPDADLARAASFAVSAGLRRCGLFEIHSAGVVHPDKEVGMLIIGPSGSGKSTLTLQLAAAGWRYLSDDELFLSLVDGEVEARGFRGFFAVDEKTANASGIGTFGDALLRDGITPAAKRCFDPKTLFPLAHAQRAIPKFLFFSSVNGKSESQLRELSQSETMQRLIRRCPWATYDKAVASENLDLLSRLARQSRAFDLFAGQDLLSSNRASQLLNDQTGLN